MNIFLALLVFHLALAAIMGLIGTICFLSPDDQQTAALQKLLKGKNLFEQNQIAKWETGRLMFENLFVRRNAQLTILGTVLVGAIAAGLGTFVHFPPQPDDRTTLTRAQYLAQNIPHLAASRPVRSSQEILDRMIPYPSQNRDPLSTLQIRQPRPWISTALPSPR